jgi:hypothetical protein
MKFELSITDSSRLTKEQIRELHIPVDSDGYMLTEDDDNYMISYIEINTIEELADFAEKYGEIIIGCYYAKRKSVEPNGMYLEII